MSAPPNLSDAFLAIGMIAVAVALCIQFGASVPLTVMVAAVVSCLCSGAMS